MARRDTVRRIDGLKNRIEPAMVVDIIIDYVPGPLDEDQTHTYRRTDHTTGKWRDCDAHGAWAK